MIRQSSRLTPRASDKPVDPVEPVLPMLKSGASQLDSTVSEDVAISQTKAPKRSRVSSRTSEKSAHDCVEKTKRYWITFQIEAKLVNGFEKIIADLPENRRNTARRAFAEKAKNAIERGEGKIKQSESTNLKDIKITMRLPIALVESIRESSDPLGLFSSGATISTMLSGYVEETLDKMIRISKKLETPN